jgi:hypothetical protein
MSEQTGTSRPARSPYVAIAIGFCCGIAVTVAWLLIFVHFAIVPEGVPYPANWTAMSSSAQIEWLQSNTVMIAGIPAVRYMLDHYARYAEHFQTVFGLSLAGSILSALITWRVHCPPEDSAPDRAR